MIVSSTLTAFRHHPLQKTRWWYVLIPFHQRPSCHYHRASFDFCWIISNVFVTNDDDCLCNVTFGLDRRAAVWCGPELYEHMAPNISPNTPWSLPRVTCAPSLCIHLSRLSASDMSRGQTLMSDAHRMLTSSRQCRGPCLCLMNLRHRGSSTIIITGSWRELSVLISWVYWLSGHAPGHHLVWVMRVLINITSTRAPVTRQSEINKLRDNLIIVAATALRPTGRYEDTAGVW